VVFSKSTETTQALLFPTVIQAIDYSPSVLEATAALIFGNAAQSLDSGQPEPTNDEQGNETEDLAEMLRDLYIE
jgi:hypothetical protein